ncbi:MAG TPA: CocE/NonD family hydrolase [Gemmatimonadaceae bacterium]|nr:CocE/NonD family hydrolase [Gemmatimonadaceae bacterium]
MRRFPSACAVAGLAAACLVASSPARAQRDGGQPDSLYTRQHYDKAEYMIAMRDGAKLYTIVYTPKDTSQAVPIMLLRTPYGIPPYPLTEYKRVLGPSPEFDQDGFIFVYQDARGKFRSEGTFRVANPYKPEKHGPKDVDESSDNYDTIDWLLKNIPHNNGRVGQWGISYPGWQTVMGMIAAHPALKASSPQSSPSDQFVGDDFHHNGAFRFMYAFNWLSGNARPRSAQTTERNRPFDYGTTDAYHFFLDIGTVARVNDVYFHGQLPTWNDFLEHPNYDAYWQDQNALKDLKHITPAVLNVTGWFDQEDFYGPMSIYYTIEKNNPGNKSTLVVGPWNHGGWGAGGGDSLGPVKFGSPTGEYFRREVQLPFFEHYLKDKGDAPPEAVVFESGTNVWKTYDSWPPKQAVKRNLYLQPGGKLAFSPPANDAAPYDSYVDDPAHPVPFTTEKRPTQGFLWMVEDQWFASTRPDVLVYQTDPLEQDLTIAGPVLAKMRVSTSGTDADFIVKVVDVFPDNTPATVTADGAVQQGGRFAARGDQRMRNYQMLVGAEVFRAKYRHSYSKPEPMVPNQVTPLEWDLRDKNHTFQKGHRIMVQVQSSWFPLIDRNPHRFMDIYSAKPSDFKPATQRVYHSPAQPSHLELLALPQ